MAKADEKSLTSQSERPSLIRHETAELKDKKDREKRNEHKTKLFAFIKASQSWNSKTMTKICQKRASSQTRACLLITTK